MPPVTIEELDDDLTPEQHLDHLLRFHEGDAKKLLATTFKHLKHKTSFFDDPDASKVLARLLRDTKGTAAKPAQPATPAQSFLNVCPLESFGIDNVASDYLHVLNVNSKLRIALSIS